MNWAPSLAAVPLAQGLHRLPVGAVEGGQGVHHPADADAALTAQSPLRHLRDLVGQDVQVLAEIRGIAHQHRDHLPGGEEADAAQVLGGQPVHRRHKGGGGAVGPALIQQDGHHHRIARPVVQIPQQAALPRVRLRLGLPLRLGVVVQHQGHQHGGLQIQPPCILAGACRNRANWASIFSRMLRSSAASPSMVSGLSI